MPVDFPSGTTGISRVYDRIDETSHRATLRSPFESGYELSRAKWTRARKEWTLHWKNMSNRSHTSLVTFFEETVSGGAESFIWHNPLSGTTYEVRFVNDKIKFSNRTKDLWDGSIKIREV